MDTKDYTALQNKILRDMYSEKKSGICNPDLPFGEKTVMGDTLTWDGNTEGLCSIMDIHYHVSDIAPTLEELQHGGIMSFSTNVSVPFDSTEVAPWSENIIVIPSEGVPKIVVVSEDNTILEAGESTMTIEKAGIYLLYEYDGDDLLYVTSLTINGYNGFPRTEITPIPEEYLPNKPTLKIKNIDSDSNRELYLDDEKIECTSYVSRYVESGSNLILILEFYDLGSNFKKITDMLWDCDFLETEYDSDNARITVTRRLYNKYLGVCDMINIMLYTTRTTSVRFYESYPD